MTRFRVLALLAAAITLVVLAGWVRPAMAVTSLSLSLEPTAALPGDKVTATGIGFPTDDPDGLPSCSLTWHASGFAEGQELSSDCMLDGSGGLHADFTVPADAAPGTYTVVARAGSVMAGKALTVQSAVTVPDVRGLTREQVLVAIRKARLSDCGSIEGEGVAVSQDPAPGTIVPEGKCLHATLRQLVAVPDLREDTLGQARTAVENAGLVLGGPSTGTGTVVGQQPAAGTLVPLGSTVTVTLSVEPPLTFVTVPDLNGKTVREADAALREIRLVLRGGGSDPDRRVAGQTPEAGTRMVQGSAVTVTLESLPAILVTVPNLRGLTVAEAGAALQLVGLVLHGGGANPDERVVDQMPVAGARVAEGSSVAVTLAVGPTATPSSGLPPGAVVAAIVMLAVLATATTAAKKRWRRRPPATGPLQFRPHPDTAAAAQIGSHDHQPLPGLRIEPHPDQTVDAVVTEVAR